MPWGGRLRTRPLVLRGNLVGCVTLGWVFAAARDITMRDPPAQNNTPRPSRPIASGPAGRARTPERCSQAALRVCTSRAPH
jgi:hypothetical protein